MKRLLLVGVSLLLGACMPSQSGPAAGVPDPLGATLTQDAGPNYTTLIYLPGKELTRQTVAHLVGPTLRVNDVRCLPESAGLACMLGTVLANERRVIYASGLSSATVDGLRVDGSKVHVDLK
ncbi:hypothetical protein [Deinococcus sp. UYEF24]